MNRIRKNEIEYELHSSGKVYASQYSYGMDRKVHDTRSEYICANQPLMKYDIKYRLDDLHGECGHSS